MPVITGTRLGPYEILALIGAGGMGEVYKARDRRLDRIVAIKISQENFSERFEREARAAAALNHPYICTLYDVGPNYLVMEFVEGQPLRGPLELEKVLEFGGQILEALDHAHRRGITHRDLKPGNILVTSQGVKLLDFGLAKMKAPPQHVATGETLTRLLDQPLTQEGQILGTLEYISPEQLQGKEADPRSDLFSFGCVLYELLTGKRAFTGHSAASVIAAILERPSPSVGALAPHSLDLVLKRSLEKDPERRWQSALDLKLALELSVTTNGSLKVDSSPASDSAPARSRGSYAAGWIAAGIFAIIAFALGFLHFRRDAPQAPVVRFSIPAPPTTSYGQTAVSPDGTRLIFSARDAQGKPSLWVRDLNSEAPRQIQGTADAALPFWSPDQRYVGFSAGSFLKRVALATGLIETICESPDAAGGAWTPDGDVIFARNLDSLYIVPAAGGTARPFTALDVSRKETRHYWPSVTPDGKSVIFTVTSSLPDVQGIWIASLANPAARHRITGDVSLATYSLGHLLFVRNENLMALPYDLDSGKTGDEAVPIVNRIPFNPTAGFADFSVSHTGVLAIGAYEQPLKLAVFDRSGKPLSQFGGDSRRYQFLTLSPDESRLASDAIDAKGYQIFVLEPARDAVAQLTSGSNTGNFPVWSPDGSRIAFGSNRDGVYNIYVKASSGASEDERVFANPRNKFLMDWSPDGRYLLYGETPPDSKRALELWTVPMTGTMTGERKPVPYVQDGLDKRDGQFSPDGRWVAYRAVEGRYPQIFVRSFPSGTVKLQVSTESGTRPRWRDDGKELFYMDITGRLLVVDIRSEGDRLIAGAPKPLFETRLTNMLISYDVYKGGQRFVMPSRLQAEFQPVSVILNWPGLLKK